MSNFATPLGEGGKKSQLFYVKWERPFCYPLAFSGGGWEGG